MNTIDLHMHSICSADGTYEPAEVMELCKKAGLKLVSLTDHNSAKGNREAAKRAEELGLRFIPGVELDCVCQGKELHLLGYGIDPEDERMHQVEDEVLRMGQEASGERIRLIKEAGICFDEEEVWAHAWHGKITGEIIAEAALKDERNREHPLMRELFPGGSRSESPLVNFYWDVCAEGKPGFVPVKYMEFERAQKLITDLGGVSVIAHPGQTVGRNPEMIRYMKEQGVVGMEINCSYHNLEQAAYFGTLAEELGLLKTAGSDFHGKIKPNVRLGVMEGDVCVKDIETLLERIEGRN